MSAGAYVEVAPPPALRPFVQRLWAHRIADPPPPEGRRLLPDGRANLVWIAGTGVQVAGPQTRYGTPPPVPRLLALGVAFHPGAAPALLRERASAFVDDHVPLEAVDPRLAARLDERLGDAPDPAAALAVYAEELTRRLARAEPPDAAVHEAVRLLDGGASVADAAARAFVSERQLQRRFGEHVGYGPKVLQRIMRFQRFLDAVTARPLELAHAAALAGYADQAHLSHETRRLAGLTPARLRTWRH